MLIGHERTVQDLKRLAKEKKIAHGYIFFGPAMVGKKLVALSFANFLESGDFAASKFLNDELKIEPDKNRTIGIDAARRLKHFLWQKPTLSPRRTAIIDDAELLTSEAQNALLKIAEEPPPSTLLILVTSDSDALTKTLSSRLQKIYFSSQPSASIEKWLIDEFAVSKKEAEKLAAKSFGKPGLAAALRNREFQERLKSAENLLKLAEGKRRDFIKKLLTDDDFNLERFLDAAIIVIASERLTKKQEVERWHKFLTLRQEASYFNLNPKLQLENLFISN